MKNTLPLLSNFIKIAIIGKSQVPMKISVNKEKSTSKALLIEALV